MDYVALLRGINIGPNNRIGMADLREALGGAGFGNVRTYVASGNVLMSGGDAAPAEVAASCRELIAERFGLDIAVVVRTREELAAVVALNPLGGVAEEPKRYQVTFLEREPDAETVARLEELASGGERLEAHGRELYSWHPTSIARSKLASALSGRALGTATARNWRTVTALLEMSAE